MNREFYYNHIEKVYYSRDFLLKKMAEMFDVNNLAQIQEFTKIVSEAANPWDDEWKEIFENIEKGNFELFGSSFKLPNHCRTLDDRPVLLQDSEREGIKIRFVDSNSVVVDIEDIENPHIKKYFQVLETEIEEAFANFDEDDYKIKFRIPYNYNIIDKVFRGRKIIGYASTHDGGAIIHTKKVSQKSKIEQYFEPLVEMLLKKWNEIDFAIDGDKIKIYIKDGKFGDNNCCMAKDQINKAFQDKEIRYRDEMQSGVIERIFIFIKN